MANKETNKKKFYTLTDEIHYSFLRQRKLFLWGEINNSSCKKIIEDFLFLEFNEKGKEIIFYINTPGGSITSGMALYDTIKLISSPVKIIVTGMAASMGSILLSAAPKGNRFLYPNARVLIHQPLIMGRLTAPAIDINIHAEEMEKQRKDLNLILANATGQSIARIEKDTDRDFYLNSKEAIEYGLADEIINRIT